MYYWLTRFFFLNKIAHQMVVGSRHTPQYETLTVVYWMGSIQNMVMSMFFFNFLSTVVAGVYNYAYAIVFVYAP